MLGGAPQQVLGVTAHAQFRCASLMYMQASGGYQVMWLQVRLLPLDSVILPSLTEAVGCLTLRHAADQTLLLLFW